LVVFFLFWHVCSAFIFAELFFFFFFKESTKWEECKNFKINRRRRKCAMKRFTYFT
jgi:hypothetical protein